MGSSLELHLGVYFQLVVDRLAQEIGESFRGGVLRICRCEEGSE
jgi:hypothetical protein